MRMRQQYHQQQQKKYEAEKIAKARWHIIIDKVGYELNIFFLFLLLVFWIGWYVCVFRVVFEIKHNGFGDIIILWLRFVSSDGRSNWILSFLMFIVIVFVSNPHFIWFFFGGLVWLFSIWSCMMLCEPWIWIAWQIKLK